MTDRAFEVREEVLNVLLAELLSERGVLSVPESIKRRVSRGERERRLPDITLADLSGVRVIIEGRILDAEADRETLLRDARRRVEEGLCPLCLAVLYPPELRRGASIPGLKKALGRAALEVRVISESDDGTWDTSSTDGLVEIIRRGYEVLVSEDVVARAVADLEAAIDEATETVTARPGSVERVADLLGIPEESRASREEDDD